MPPRRLSQKSLENAALFYLQRYSSTVKSLRRVLVRKVDRAHKRHGGDRDQALEWIDALLRRLERSGYLNDQRFAQTHAQSLQRRGNSLRRIQLRLQQKGVAPALVQESVQALRSDGGNAEWDAILAYARRRRLGPFRRAALTDRVARTKELASFARVGFPFSLALKVVDATSAEALEGLREETE